MYIPPKKTCLPQLEISSISINGYVQISSDFWSNIIKKESFFYLKAIKIQEKKKGQEH